MTSTSTTHDNRTKIVIENICEGDTKRLKRLAVNKYGLGLIWNIILGFEYKADNKLLKENPGVRFGICIWRATGKNDNG